MPKTPDEIKKGLECRVRSYKDVCDHQCDTCDLRIPAYSIYERYEDALALIQQLESDKQQLEGMLAHMNQLCDAAAGRALKMEERVHQLEAERDAAIHDMYEAQSIVCLICKNYYQPDPAVKKYGCKVLGEHFGEGSIFCGMFEWSGVQKEE